MSNQLITITAPASLPVSVADMKQHLRVDISDDDTLIQSLIAAATRAAEVATDRQLITATYQQKWDRFPPYLKLLRPPLQTVNFIKYIDTGGVLQTLETYRYNVSTSKQPAEVWPAFGYVWPPTRSIIECVTVEFVCGATEAPPAVIHAIKLMVGHWYENREETSEKQLYQIPLAARHLLGIEWSAEY